MKNLLQNAIYNLENQVLQMKNKIELLQSNGSSFNDVEHLKTKIRRCKLELNELRFQDNRNRLV
ncbi:hypothetical protein HNR74_003478 [Flammeovirga kamogawensis]|nr:hypothetical protein [Flammeovirga kamogawensis]